MRPPSSYPCRAFDIGGGGRGAERSTDHGPAGIGDERLAQPWQPSFVVEEARLVRHPDQRAGRIEHHDKKQSEHGRDEAEPEDAGKVHGEKCRRERRRERGHAVPRLEPEGDGKQRSGEHADDDGARDFSRGKPRDRKEPADREQRFWPRQIAERDERDGVVGNDPCVLQADQREEQTDAGGDAELQVHRDGVDEPCAQRRERQQKEQGARNEHDTKRKPPVAA